MVYATMICQKKKITHWLVNCLLSFYQELLYSEYMTSWKISLTYFPAQMTMSVGTGSSPSASFCLPALNSAARHIERMCTFQISISRIIQMGSSGAPCVLHPSPPLRRAAGASLTPWIYLYSHHILYWLNQVLLFLIRFYVLYLSFHRIQSIVKRTFLNRHDVIYVKTVAGKTHFFPCSNLSCFFSNRSPIFG